MPDRELHLATNPQAAAPLDREAEIAQLVRRFYEVARDDPMLGPVFERHVADWERHLRTMNDFWSAAVYRTGRYAGRPIEAHRGIAGLTGEHFTRWLELWTRTVDEVVRSDARETLKELARRMADTMSQRLGTRGGSKRG